MLGNQNLYRKPHYLMMQSIRGNQRVQRNQEATRDHLYLRSGTSGVIRARQYESLRRVVSRKLLRTVRFLLDRRAVVAVTAKPREIRMGKGKGAFSHYVLGIRVGMKYARISWCWRRPLSQVILVTQRSCRKSGCALYF